MKTIIMEFKVDLLVTNEQYEKELAQIENTIEQFYDANLGIKECQGGYVRIILEDKIHEKVKEAK